MSTKHRYPYVRSAMSRLFAMLVPLLLCVGGPAHVHGPDASKAFRRGHVDFTLNCAVYLRDTSRTPAPPP